MRKLSKEEYERILDLGYLTFYDSRLTGDFEADFKIWHPLFLKLYRKKRYLEYLENKKNELISRIHKDA